MSVEKMQIFKKSKVSAGSSSELTKNIFTTVAYYDGMNYPLSAFEVWKCLIQVQSEFKKEFSLNDVIDKLDEYEVKKFVEEQKGFYFLRGRKELAEKRIACDKISTAKIKRLKKIVRFLKFAPFVRMIVTTGRLAMKNAEKESDWDVLVVLKKGKIWTGRTLVTLFLHLIGKRRYKEKIKDRICLNHFITDESLNVSIGDDYPEFSAHEFSFMTPLFDVGIFRKFQLKNSWVKNYKPNFYLNEAGTLNLLKDSGASKMIRGIGERLLNWNFLENWLRSWQKKKIARNPKTVLPGSFIRALDERLVFLPDPQGPKLLDHLKRKMENMGF